MLSLPPRTREELLARERAEDADALLRETWAHYAQRTGRQPHDDGTDAATTVVPVKHVDETWDAYMLRKAAQRAYMAARERKADAAARRDEARQHLATQRSAATVALVMQQLQSASDARHVPARHCLHVDHDALQRAKFACERQRNTAAETLLREAIERSYDALHAMLRTAAVHNARVCAQRQREREQSEADARARAAAEAKRDAEAAHARELQRRRELLEAQQRQKEEAEQAKRAERRRRDEERRARRRSELAAATPSSNTTSGAAGTQTTTTSSSLATSHASM